MVAIDVTAAYATLLQSTGTARRKAKTTQNQMELVGVRVRGLMRCQ